MSKIKNELREFKAEMYVDSDETLRAVGELAKMILKLDKGKALSGKQKEYLSILINDAETYSHKYDNFCLTGDARFETITELKEHKKFLKSVKTPF